MLTQIYLLLEPPPSPYCYHPSSYRKKQTWEMSQAPQASLCKLLLGQGNSLSGHFFPSTLTGGRVSQVKKQEFQPHYLLKYQEYEYPGPICHIYHSGYIWAKRTKIDIMQKSIKQMSTLDLKYTNLQTGPIKKK